MVGRRQATPRRSRNATLQGDVARFWTHAEQYYRTLTDNRNKELERIALPCGR